MRTGFLCEGWGVDAGCFIAIIRFGDSTRESASKAVRYDPLTRSPCFVDGEATTPVK